MGSKIGGMFGAGIRASNTINRIQSGKQSTNKHGNKRGLDLVTMPSELFSAFGMPAPKNGKSFLVTETYVPLRDRTVEDTDIEK